LPLWARPRNALRFPRPRAALPPRPVLPAPREVSARPALGGHGVRVALWQGRWPLPWQRRWWFGFCRSAPLRAGKGNALRFPRPRAERCHQDPCHPHQQRSAPDPAGEKRPPGAGRALAGGFGPRLAKDQGGAVAGAMAPANAAGLVVRSVVFRPVPGGTPKRTAVPPPARGAAAKTRAARTKRGQRPPVAGVQGGRARAAGFLAPGGPGSAWRCGRGDGPCQDAQGRAGGRVSRFSVRQPLRGACFSTLVKALSMAEHGV
jgi:hypothetical protein